MAELSQELLAWVSAHPGWAHLSVFLVALVESLAIVGLIVPGVIMMVGAGALIATEALDFWPVCLWAVAGAVTGDGVSYWLGRHYQGRLRILWPFSRYPESLGAGVRFFEKYGGKSVAFGRFVGPVRAVIPLVAGMLGMTPGRFLLANVLSAIVWAPAYLLPGIVFGASLELAAEAAFRLVLLLIALVASVWFAAWAVQQLFLIYSPRAKGWVEGLLRWAEVHPRMGDIARSLADPGHPDATTLASLAGVLLLTTALFTVVMGFAVRGAPDLPLNRTVLDLALSLQTPTANYLMAAFSRLGNLGIILPVVLVLCAWLYWLGERRQANYWLAAGAFAVLAGPLLKVLLRVPRPDTAVPTLTSWSFPSSHSLRATVVYGFLAVVLAGGMSPAWRWLPYVWASILITVVGVSCLYFGVHWLTDVIGSLSLGLTWVAMLGLAYRRHTQVGKKWLGLAGTAVGTLVIAFGVQSAVSGDFGLGHFQRAEETITITEEGWKAGAWRRLPRTRDDLRQVARHPLSLQYAGALDELRRRLAVRGWESATPLTWRTAMRLLSPTLPLAELPVIPHVHGGRHETLALVKSAPYGGRFVLRLWATPYRIDGRTPVWIGNVTTQHKREILGVLAIPATDPEPLSSLNSVQDDFSALHPYRPDEAAPLLLLPLPGVRS
jgi:membrane protein DedA with SNARE-associated domain/membrane-associated phospholipid phosphatase